MRLPTYRERYVDQIQGADEAMPRGRRLDVFVKAAKLTSVTKEGARNAFLKGCDVDKRHLNHVSLWMTESGAQVLLVEPYCIVPPVVKRGFFIQVPIAISPYCGRYDVAPSALPWTRSWLVAHESD